MKSDVGQVKKKLPSAEHAGHRSRVRARFIRNGFDGMLDYEVMEALLMQVLPRKDVKPLAKKLLARFGSVSETLDQPLEVLEKFPGLGTTSAVGLKMYNDIALYCLQEKCFHPGSLLNNQELIINFVRMKMGLKKHESYMMLFMDGSYQLLEYRIIAEGTVNYVIAYLRNIMEMAMEIGAASVILVHNHPSGLCAPSDEDIETTREIYKALKSVEVELIDHLIVTHDDHFSFLAHNLHKNSQKKG